MNRARTRSPIVWLLLLAAAILAAVGGMKIYARLFVPTRHEEAIAGIVVVSVLEIQGRRLDEIHEVTGFLRPTDSVRVAAEVAGRIVEKVKHEVDRVQANDLIARIDDSLHQATVRAARARGEALEAQLGFNRRELERVRRLVERRSLGEAELDRITSEVARLEASRRENTAGFDIALRDLANCEIRTTRAGVIHVDLVKEGEYVQPGTPVVEIRIVDTLELEVEVSPALRLLVKVAEKVPVTLLDVDSALHDRAARLEGVVARLPQGSVTESRRFPVVLEVDNAAGDLVPGLFCLVRFQHSSPGEVILVPKIAVQRRYGQSWVHVVERPEAAWVVRERPVTVAPVIDRPAEWNVIDGLEAGERIVVFPLDRIRDGMEVELES